MTTPRHHKYVAALVAILACLASCKDRQSKQQAMKEICAGPPVPEWFEKLSPPERVAAGPRFVEEQAAWYQENVTNTYGRELLAKLAQLETYHWSREISAAAKDANVRPCPFAESRGPIIPSEAVVIDSPDLLGYGIEALPIVAITQGSISIDGDKVVHLRDGKVDDYDVEGGALGRSIKPLKSYKVAEPKELEHRVRTFSASGPAPKAIAVFAEPTTSYGLLFKTIASLRGNEGKFRRFELLVATKEGTLGSLPMRLPDFTPLPGASEKQPLGLLVSLTDKKLLLWSVSGLEGTLAEPALIIDRDPNTPDEYDFAKLSAKLLEIVERRWPDGNRESADHELLLQADGNTPYRIIAKFVAVAQTEKLQFSTLFAMPIAN